MVFLVAATAFHLRARFEAAGFPTGADQKSEINGRREHRKRMHAARSVGRKIAAGGFCEKSRDKEEFEVRLQILI